jgi:hypothetical protein
MRALVGVLLLTPALALAGSIDDLDAKNGFRDLTFGTPSSDVADLQGKRSAGDQPEVFGYSRSGDKLFIGEVPVKITWRFFKDRLYEVRIEAAYVGASELLKSFQASYGLPTDLGEFSAGDFFVWKGRKVRIRMMISAKFKSTDITIGSIEMEKQMDAVKEADQEAAARKGAGDL